MRERGKSVIIYHQCLSIYTVGLFYDWFPASGVGAVTYIFLNVFISTDDMWVRWFFSKDELWMGDLPNFLEMTCRAPWINQCELCSGAVGVNSHMA